MSEIKQLLVKLLKDVLRDQVIRGRVTAIDTQECTIEVAPLDGRAVMFDVQLKAIKNGSDLGLIVFPKVGSDVLVGLIQNDVNSAYLAQCTEFERILISQQNGIKLEVTAAGEFVLNGGQLGGMVKVNDLVQDLNNVKTQINQLKTILATWAVVPGDGGAALKLASATWYSSQIPPSNASQLENPKVKH